MARHETRAITRGAGFVKELSFGCCKLEFWLCPPGLEFWPDESGQPVLLVGSLGLSAPHVSLPQVLLLKVDDFVELGVVPVVLFDVLEWMFIGRRGWFVRFEPYFADTTCLDLKTCWFVCLIWILSYIILFVILNIDAQQKVWVSSLFQAMQKRWCVQNRYENE